jgi:hypothetical protein
MIDTRSGPKNALRAAGAARARRSADEDRGLMEMLGSPGEDRAMNEIAHRVLGDASVAHDFVGAAIEGHDAVKHAGVRGAIELK